MDERQLIDRVLGGDSIAERELYDLHVDRVFRLMFRMTGDDDLARECTQETFIRAFERLEGFRGEARLSTWLHSIAVSVALNTLRKVKRFGDREVEIDSVPAMAATGREAEPDLKERLRREIDALPEGYRTVFVLYDVEGYTHEEIAGVLGIAVGTSKAQLFRARGKLRAALKDFAGEWV